MADRWAGWGLPSLTRRLDGIEPGRRRRHRPRDVDDGDRASRSPTRPAARARRPTARIRVEETVDDPGRDRGPAAGRHGPGAGAGARGGRVVRARAARDVPGPRRAAGASGRWSSTVTDQLVAYVRPQENGGHAGHALVPGRRRGRRRDPRRPRPPRPGLGLPRRPPPISTRRTHDVEVRPRAETIVHIDAAHRGVGTASCGPDTLEPYVLRGGELPLGVDDPRRRTPAVTIRLGRRRPASGTSHNGRTSFAMRVLENGWLGHLHAGAPLRRAASLRPPGPAPVRGLRQPGRRAGRARGARCRASATSGCRRWSSRRRTGRRSSTCATPATGSPRGKPDLGRASRRPTRAGRRGGDARGRPRRRADRPAGHACARRCSRDRPVVARSLTLANGGDGAADRALRDVAPSLDLPDDDWTLVTLSAAPGRASATSSSGRSSRAGSPSAACAAARGARAQPVPRPPPRRDDRGRRRGLRR